MSRRNNNQQMSLREASQNRPSPTTGYHLSDGVRNFLLGVLIWQFLSGLFLVTGWHQLFDAFEGFKFFLGVLVCIMPLIAAMFILILYDREG